MIKEGLKLLPDDKRDFKFAGIHKKPKLKDLPEKFIVAEPLKIKDQGMSYKCTGYASASVSEDQEGMPLDPHWQYSKIKQIEGEVEGSGANLRSACKALVEYGSVTEKEANGQTDIDWKKWPVNLSKIGVERAKKSYFDIEWGFDTFDNMRAVMWASRAEKRSILTGCIWRMNWTHEKDGIIENLDTKAPGQAHAFKVYGWDGDFIIAQLSNGEKIGDKGTFYIHRHIVNQEFKYGAFTFKDIDPEEVRRMQENKIKVGDNLLVQILKIFISKFN